MNLVLLLLALSGANAPRENEKALRYLEAGDTTQALRHLERAAKADTSDPRYSYNLGTVQGSKNPSSAETALTRAIQKARTPSEKARALYNRGTTRLVQAQQAHAAKQAAPQDAAQQPSADPGKAIEDLREALRLRPQWTEAAHNLDLALRLREQNKKDQNQKQDPKNKPDPQNQDKKDPQPKSQDPQSNPQSSPEPQPQTGMNQQDAQRLLDGAQAQEAAKMRAKKQKNQRKNDGPDW